jgi:hemerythrin-like metal-binding protein
VEKSEWKISWSDYLSVGIPEMDAEHREFIARVNELNQSIIGADDKSTVERRMSLMLMQAADHFAHEEELLQKLNFPQLAAHRAKHAALTARFERVMQEFGASDVSFVWALKGLQLKQLLVEHLLQEDMIYRDFVRGTGTTDQSGSEASGCGNAFR